MLSREVLPTHVTPEKYTVELEPLFDSFTYNGLVTVALKVNEDSSDVTLNTIDIEYLEASVDGEKVLLWLEDTNLERVTFKLATSLKAGTHASLYMRFKGILNDKMCGLYKSTYVEDGVTKYLATTQMESTDCRRAFPCFDEPALKAKFDVTLISRSEHVCLSNMDVKHEEDLGDGRKKVVFHTSPLMSTYLVAFVVGDLRYVENTTYRVPIKVYATPGNEHLGRYGADLAAKTLAFFDEQFDIPYPLPKLDMVAIHDFLAGAMENFGLVTYRTVDLLIDPANTNASTMQRVTEVVMHELAHQWFGNLVTMDFWDGLWLNEGFATWMSWYACNALYPEWKVWEYYITDSLQTALSLDALRASHPVEVPLYRAEDVHQVFDAILYEKGSSLLRMLALWIGEETFIKGISVYLKRHMWGNTQSSDLWQALSDVSGHDVVAVMDIWTRKIGFPVVQVKEQDGHLKISQNRFLATGDVQEDEDTVEYPAFLGLKTSNGVDNAAVLSERYTSQVIPKDDFFKINTNNAGFYRTSYESQRWTKLAQAGVDGKLSVEDRVGLVGDAGALASPGYAKTTDLLNLVISWKHENNYVVWEEMLKRVGSLKSAFMFEDETVTAGLNAFSVDFISHKLAETGYDISDDDSIAEQKLKGSLFGTAAASGDKKVVEYAHKAFAEFVGGNRKAFNPNLRAPIFNTVAKTGDMAVYEQLFAIYSEPQSIEEKLAALQAMGRFRDPAVLKKLTSILLGGEIIKPQDVFIPLRGLASHRVGCETLWEWLTTKWADIYEEFPYSGTMLKSIVIICTSGFTSREWIAKINAFFEGKDTKGYDKGLAQALDTVKAKTNWVERDLVVVQKWLAEKKYL